MPKDRSIRRDGLSTARRGPLLLAIVAGGAGLFGAGIASAQGAVPMAGCYGTCGGDFGPMPAALFVSSQSTLEGFAIAERCLGRRQATGPVGEVVDENDAIGWPPPTTTTRSAPPMPKIRGGRVVSEGKAHIDGEPSKPDVSFKLVVTFPTPSEARGILSVKYSNCKPFHFKARFA
jgi:hypothetical protein